jgi:Na+-transporting methylmalonyl-CoA/oxaloacetate decarboxylase gamma subunit
MRMLLVLLLTTFLIGCVSVGAPKFPEAPKEIKEPCPQLNLVDRDEEKLSEVLKVIVENYGKYHECAAKVDAWIKWHNEHEKIYKELRNGK